MTGQFVGTETGQNAGRAVIGTWKVGDGNDADDQPELEGSFGAERIRTNPATLPSLTSTNRYLVKSSTIFEGGTTIGDATTTAPTLTLGNTAYTDTFPLSSLGNVTNRAQTGAPNLRATIRLRNTSFARSVPGKWRTAIILQRQATGLFAYSPLADTSFAGDNANYYPLRVNAEYAGRTVAIDGNGRLYDGSYLLTVDWNADGSSNNALTAVISGLSGFTIGGDPVSQIGFSQTFTGDDFSGAPTTTRVRYTTGSDGSLTGSTHQGQFVGNNGTRWSLRCLRNMEYYRRRRYQRGLRRGPRSGSLIAIATSRWRC